MSTTTDRQLRALMYTALGQSRIEGAASPVAVPAAQLADILEELLDYRRIEAGPQGEAEP